MANILDYLDWRGDLQISERGFNEVDNLLLAELCYLDFGGIVPPGFDAPVPLQEAMRRYDVLREHESMGVLVPDQIPELGRRMAASARFSGLLLCGYENKIDDETQTQFSALTLLLPDGTAYVAFRGTDDTIVGWKEDFNLAFLPVVPAQRMAVQYLQAAAEVFSERPLRVGGHSKGGNLAVYAGAFCSEAAQQRIELVYNFDGPGFDRKILDQAGYEAICPRVRTFVPQSSVVGMLLGHEEQYTVVHSQETGLTQHNIYTWDVERESLSYLDTVTHGSRFIDRTLKDWLAGMSVEQRAVLVDTVYEVMQQTGARTVPELKANWFGSTRAMIRAAGALNEDDRRSVMRMLRLLMQSAIGELSGADKETSKA